MYNFGTTKARKEVEVSLERSRRISFTQNIDNTNRILVAEAWRYHMCTD